MKFSVAPESSRVGVSVLLCMAWTYALRLIDFRLDMYTLSDVLLNWAAWVRCASASLFSDSSASCGRSSGSDVVGLSSGRLNVTNFVGRINESVVSLALPLSELPESYRVSLPVESSLKGRYGVGSGFRSPW